MNKVMREGTKGPHKGVFKKTLTVNGYKVEVTYVKRKGVVKIGNGWVNTEN